MKFLCDNCKAKYQIADDKLGGRSVHMKCRKCGHLIKVPPPVSAPAPSTAAAEGVASRPAVVAPATAAAHAPAAPAVNKQLAKPAVGARPVAPVRPSAPKAPEVATPKPPVVAHRAAPVAPPPKAAPVAIKPTAAAAKPTAPAARAPSALPRPAAPPRPSAPGSGLAGAFSRSVQARPSESSVSAAIEVLSAGAAEEWYVGINGVPLGPVRLSTLRHKAAQGVVNEESLVWREGFDEWRPLRTFPELVVLVQEARESASRSALTPSASRASATPPPPVSARSAKVPQLPQVSAAPPAPPSVARISALPRPPVPTPVLPHEPVERAAKPEAPKPSVEPLAAKVPNLEAAAGAEVLKDPFAAGAIEAPAPGSLEGLATPTKAPRRSEPPAPERVSVVDEVALGIKRQARMHPAVYAFIALAFGFGVTTSIVMFWDKRGTAAAPTVQIVTVTAPPVAAPVAAPTASVADNSAINITGDTTRRAATGGASPAQGKTPDKAGGAAEPMPGLDMPGLPGPSVPGPKAGAGDNSNLPQLAQGDIERVVASQRGLVRRQCWDPALSSRSANAPSTAKVSVSLTIGADGAVQGVSASGGAGYPDLASCVATRVRGWKFPPSSGTTPTVIPFVFAAQ